MKIKHVLTLLLTFGIATIFSGCKSSDDELSAEEFQQAKLAGAWIVGTTGSVTREDLPLDDWDDFTLTIGKGTFSTTTSEEEIWPSSGTWTFVTGNLNQFERNDGIIVDISSVSESLLTLNFTIDESSPGGRLKRLNGEYTFVLVKQ